MTLMQRLILMAIMDKPMKMKREVKLDERWNQLSDVQKAKYREIMAMPVVPHNPTLQPRFTEGVWGRGVDITKIPKTKM